MILQSHPARTQEASATYILRSGNNIDSLSPFDRHPSAGWLLSSGLAPPISALFGFPLSNRKSGPAGNQSRRVFQNKAIAPNRDKVLWFRSRLAANDKDRCQLRGSEVAKSGKAEIPNIWAFSGLGELRPACVRGPERARVPARRYLILRTCLRGSINSCAEQRRHHPQRKCGHLSPGLAVALRLSLAQVPNSVLRDFVATTLRTLRTPSISSSSV